MHPSFIYAAEDDVGDGDVPFGGSIQGALAEAFAEGDTAGLATISGIFAGLHHYLGNFLGESLVSFR